MSDFERLHLGWTHSNRDESVSDEDSEPDVSYSVDTPDIEALRFTIDGYEPEHTWTAKRFGRDWNGWATPVVDRATLEAVMAASDDEPVRYLEDTALVDGSSIKPDDEGLYDLGLLGWCFIEMSDAPMTDIRRQQTMKAAAQEIRSYLETNRYLKPVDKSTDDAPTCWE